MTLLEELQAYKKDSSPLQKRYEAFIADTTKPLDERWEVFCAAPTDFKKHDGWIHHFDAEKLLPGGELSWYDDFYVEKYQTVDMETLVMWMTERLEYDEDDRLGLTEEIIKAWKDEILVKNLGSFRFDW